MDEDEEMAPITIQPGLGMTYAEISSRVQL